MSPPNRWIATWLGILALAPPATVFAQSPTATASAATEPATPEPAAPTPAASGNPHQKLDLKDSSVAVPEIPPGTLEVLLLDPSGRGIPGATVSLEILHSSIAEGDTKSSRSAGSDDSGRAVFTGLATTTDYTYQVRVDVEPAQFSSAKFPLRTDMGQRQKLHLFPITRSQKDAQVVGRGVIAIHPQDDVFLIDVLYQLINLGSQAWVPEDVTLELPKGWKAFTTQDAAAGTRLDQSDPIGAKLVGTFSPGAREVGFRFQVDNPHDENISFQLPLLPRTVEMRVIVEASAQMSLRVPGFDTPFVDHMRSGERVLVAEKSFLNRREPSPEMLSVTIGGMPIKGYGHKVALAIAVLIVAAGIAQLLAKPEENKRFEALAPEDLIHARTLLLDELVALEQARETKAIGTKTYQHTRQILLTSLARLLGLESGSPS